MKKKNKHKHEGERLFAVWLSETEYDRLTTHIERFDGQNFSEKARDFLRWNAIYQEVQEMKNHKNKKEVKEPLTTKSEFQREVI